MEFELWVEEDGNKLVIAKLVQPKKMSSSDFEEFVYKLRNEFREKLKDEFVNLDEM